MLGCEERFTAPDERIRGRSLPQKRTVSARAQRRTLIAGLRSFRAFGKRTILTTTRSRDSAGSCVEVETFINEFWTSKQRAANSPYHA